MTSREAAKKYENNPIGTPQRRIYDFYYAPKAIFLERYYKAIDLSQWNHLVNYFKKYKPLIEGEKVENLFRYSKFNLEQTRHIYNKSLSTKVFDEDISLFFAVLMANGFFDYYEITFDEWLNSKNYKKPSNENEALQDCGTIYGWAQYKYGLNLIKQNLSSLDYWRIIGGR